MQVFVPYIDPFLTACALDKKRLNKQIVECGQILRAINNPAATWSHHPIVEMWKRNSLWLHIYRDVLVCYRAGKILQAAEMGRDSRRIKPLFLTEELNIQHRRRLYTKDPVHYADWARFGTSDENWYCIGGKVVKYVNGKRI